MVSSTINKKLAKKKGEKGQKNSLTLYDLTPVIEIMGSKAFLVSPLDGSITIGLALALPPIESLEKGDYDHFHALLNQGFTELPAGTLVQKHDIYMNGQFNPPGLEEGFFLRAGIEHYMGIPLSYHKSFIYLTFPTNGKKKVKRKSPLSSSIFRSRFMVSKGLSNPYEHISTEIVTEAFEICERMVITLEGVKGLAIRYLNAPELKQNLLEFGNLAFSQSQESEARNVSPQSYQRALGVEDGITYLGEKKLQILSLAGQGNVTQSFVESPNGIPYAFIESLGFGINCPHVVVQNFMIADTEEELKGIDWDKKLRALTPSRDEKQQIELENLTKLTLEMRQDQSKFIFLTLQVLVWATSNEELTQATNAVLEPFSKISTEIEVYVEKEEDTRMLFLSNFPGLGLGNYRQVLMPSYEAICYTLKESGNSLGKGELLFWDRMDNPVRFPLWRKGIKGQNMILIGPTGSGKSFLSQHVIACQDERLKNEDPDVDRHYIIDVGGSYYGITLQKQGNYFETGAGKDTQLRFNPFACEKDENGHYIFASENDGESNKLITLVTLLRTIYKSQEALTPTETSAIKNLIIFFYVSKSYEKSGGEAANLNMNAFFAFVKDYFESKGYMGYENSQEEALQRLQERMISFFDNYLYTDKYFDLRAFLMVLEDFVGDGTYASYLNAEESLDITSTRINTFDLEGVKSDERLYPIVAILIIELILESFKKYPTARKHLYIDEAWSMFSGPMKDFIEYMVRTCRKKNGSLVIVTQGIKEIDDSPIGATLVSNSSKLILLDHKGKEESVDRLQQVLKLTDGQVAMLQDIQNLGDRRDLLIIIEGKAQLLRYKPSPEEVVAFSSESEDMKARRDFAKKYDGNMEVVVNQMIENQHIAKVQHELEKSSENNLGREGGTHHE